MRVLIVDDSSFMRRMLTRLLENESGVEVVGTASNGREAIELIDSLDPDIMTLDIQMPVLNGLETLEELAKRPRSARPPVLVCSSLTREGSEEALHAMQIGASDFILKDAVKAAGADADFKAELLKKMRAIARRRRTVAPRPEPAAAPMIDSAKGLDGVRRRAWRLVVIGSSTGGPPVLETVLQAIPKDTAASFVVAQHMPEVFTKSLADRLDRKCGIAVELADSSRPIMPGKVYIGAGGRHVRIGGRAAPRLDITDEPREASYKPSVDVLFESAARAFPSETLGVVLTGMGCDGAIGAKALAGAGGAVIAQDEASCVVYGMPKAAADNGAACALCPPERVAELFASLRTAGSGGGNPREPGRLCA